MSIYNVHVLIHPAHRLDDYGKGPVNDSSVLARGSSIEWCSLKGQSIAVVLSHSLAHIKAMR